MFTERQLQVIKAHEKIVEVNSPPGSGKSHCIMGVVERNKNKKILVVCFNASIKEELIKKASLKGLSNAEFFTFHGLAFKFFKNSTIIKNFSKRNFGNDLDFFTTRDLLKDVFGKDFTNEEISETKEKLTNFFQTSENSETFFKKEKEFYSKILNYIKDNPEAPMFHGFYIKVFQLLKYRTLNHSMVLVDEAQDKSSCYASIIKNLKCDREFYFGDSYQMIYGFNGAIGMGKSNYKLDRSFRIGKQSSDMCNRLIRDFINKDSQGFEGVNVNQFLVDKLPQFEQKTIICRTNKKIIEYLDLCVKDEKFCYIIGGKESIGLEEIKKYISNPGNYNYKGFKASSLEDLQTIYKITNESKVKTMAETISSLKIKTLSDVQRLERTILPEPDLADIILTTVHRSKGMEFKNVEIANDFKSMRDLYKLKDTSNVSDEIYILYVALSRSFGNLKLNDDLKEWYNNYSSFVEEQPSFEENLKL